MRDGRGGAHLVVELYDRGNLVLTDATHEILILLRNSKHDADAAVSVHDAYPISVKQELPTLSAAWLASQMQAAEPSTALRQLLTRCVPVGKEAVEHALTLSQLAPNTKMSARPWDDATSSPRPRRAQDATEGFRGAAAGATPASSFAERRRRRRRRQQRRRRRRRRRRGVRGVRADRFAQYSGAAAAVRDILGAVDEFFYRSEAEREAAEYASQQGAAWKKVDKIREAQEGRVEGLRVKEAEDEARAQLIEYNLVEIDALLALIRSALDAGMDWEEIERLVGESAKQGDELASLVLSLDLRNGAIVVALSPDDDDDAGEAALTAAALAVRLDVRQSALANARDYYSGRKAARCRRGRRRRRRRRRCARRRRRRRVRWRTSK